MGTSKKAGFKKTLTEVSDNADKYVKYQELYLPIIGRIHNKETIHARPIIINALDLVRFPMYFSGIVIDQ